ncbi:MAG TPA: hypothetical protein VKT77_04000, partial [Chthonomonadaceae bacterium]|nr:hypothetical protein [Chthonomonadaceae bacterium]
MSTSMDMDRDDRWNGLPVAPSYPEASPGNLDMNYWSDFTRRHMHSGNSYDTRVSRMDHDMRPMAEIRKEEIEELYPVAPSYPEADPAGLDMWCWMGIRKLHTRPGSAAEVAWIRRDLHMSHRLSTGPLWNDVEPIPAAPAYPEEAPGNLDLYHWKDWRRFRMSPGNAGDMRKREASNTQVQ